MSDLATMLAEELRDKGWGLREAEEEIKVSRSALANILNGKEQVPTMETFDKLATYFKLPLWRVIQMHGIELGLPSTVNETIRQLTSLVERMPELEPIVKYLLNLYPEDLRGVVAYLKLLDQQHNRDLGWAE